MKKKTSKKYYRRYDFLIVLFFIVFGAIAVSGFVWVLTPKQILPVYQPAMIDPKLVDESIQFVKKYHTIAPFTMINQNGQTITEKDYENKVYVADFFFTTCPSICPIMTKNMFSLQEKLKTKYPEVKLLSYSVTPEIDTIEQLKRYAVENKVDDKIWNLVTGDKKEIYNLARKSYLVVQNDGNGGPHDMIHTENFVLIDKENRVRGYYDGTDINEMDRLIIEIGMLKND
ncbi:MAG: SCO family protein [Flavobacteriales bacterium]|nr:SCO family protein [Flavobacteriales bacterium]